MNAHPAVRLILHGLVGWALCSAAMGGLLAVVELDTALALHAVAAPLIFVAVSANYFRKPDAQAPLPTALAFTATVALTDLLVIAGLVLRNLAMFSSVIGTWLPFTLIFLATLATGEAIARRRSGAR